MKVFMWAIVALIVVVGAVFTVVFTPFGNSLVQPTLEAKIKEQTHLNTKLKTFVLSMSKIDILLELSKNNTIAIKGNYSPFSQSMDLTYDINLQELAILKPITNADVRGPFQMSGAVKGSKESLVVDGKSDVALSNTSFQATLKDFQPNMLRANIKHLQLSKLLYMIKQPHYADASFDMNANLTSLTMGALKGEIRADITKGVLDSKFMTKEYKFKTSMPKTKFSAKTITSLGGNHIATKADILSTLANLHVKKALFNIKDASFKSDYLAKVPSLDKLYFATDRHMRGGITANGELKKAKDLDFTLHSKLVGGNIDAKLHNNDFHADLKSLQTLDTLHMLMYPEMFKSTLNGVVDYNLAQQKGIFQADLKDGKFTQNQVLSLVKQFANINLYKQMFKGTTSATINKEKIVASLDLRSNTSSIKTKDTKLNSKTKQINSKLDIVANNHPLSMTLTGKATAPHVKVDAEKIIKKEAQKAIKKKLGDVLKGFF